MKKILLFVVCFASLLTSVHADILTPGVLSGMTGSQVQATQIAKVSKDSLYGVVYSQDKKHWSGYGYSEDDTYLIYTDGIVKNEISTYPSDLFYSKNALYYLTSEYGEDYSYEYTFWKDHAPLYQGSMIQVSSKEKFGKDRYVSILADDVFTLATLSGKKLLQVGDVASVSSYYDAALDVMQTTLTKKDGTNLLYFGNIYISDSIESFEKIGNIETNTSKEVLFRGTQYEDDITTYLFFRYNLSTREVSWIDAPAGTMFQSYDGAYQYTIDEVGYVNRFWYVIQDQNELYSVIDGLTLKSLYTGLKSQPYLYTYGMSIGIAYTKGNRYFLSLDGKTYGPYDALGTFQNGDLSGFEMTNSSDWWIIVRKNHKNFLLLNGKEFPF